MRPSAKKLSEKAAGQLRAAVEARAAAEKAGLRYVTDGEAGIARQRAGEGFCYRLPSGGVVRRAEILARIRALAVPPAWTEVWICVDEAGHLQATGRDARGRKQYRYHARWRERRDGSKFGRMPEFARALPRIRAAVRRHLKLPGLPREKVLAAVVSLLEKSLIRVGNDEYAEANGSHGLTTLQDGHAVIRGTSIRFRFPGKSGRRHEIVVEDAGLAGIVKKCQALPGGELFQYCEGPARVRDVTSGEVNDYLREISGGNFTAKDFRTWAGTVEAARRLARLPRPSTRTEARRQLRRVVEEVAACLGNTPAVCRKSYIHPAVAEAWMTAAPVKTKPPAAAEAGQRPLPAGWRAGPSRPQVDSALFSLLPAFPGIPGCGRRRRCA